MTSGRPDRLRALLLGAWLACQAAAAQGFDAAALMQRLAEAPAGEVAYVEKRYSDLLARPVESRGRLTYRRPDTVEKIVESPRVERYRFEGDVLTVTREGKAVQVKLAGQPLLAAFAASLRGVLAGDAALLARHFRSTLAGNESSWRLDLVPIDPAIARTLARVTMSGQGGRLTQIEVREAGGDRSVMQVLAAAAVTGK